MTGWPPVSYEVRDRAGTSARRSADGWPLPGTSWEPLYLDAGTGSLRRDAPADAGSVSYDSEQAGRGRCRATFDLRFETATELVGNARLRIWMSAPEADDLDVFVALQKLDRYGDLVGFPYYAVRLPPAHPRRTRLKRETAPGRGGRRRRAERWTAPSRGAAVYPLMILKTFRCMRGKVFRILELQGSRRCGGVVVG